MNNVHDVERDRFEAAMVAAEFGSASFIHSCRMGDGYRAGFYSSAYVGWMAGKMDAREQAKPVASIRKRKDQHQWAVYVPTSLTATAYDFPHREDAVEWAVKHGYRVE